MKRLFQLSMTAAGSSGLLHPRQQSKPVNFSQSRPFKAPASKLVTDPKLPAKAVFPGSGLVVDPAQSTYVRVYAARSQQWERVRETTKKLQRSVAATSANATVA